MGWQNFKLEKYRQTIELCKNFDDWYRYSREPRIDSLATVFKKWEGTIPQDSSWIGLSDSIKMEILKNSVSVNRVFHYFEEAKMLDKRNLLDDEYFYNFFYNFFVRLEKIKNPSVKQYIDAKRKHGGDDEIWDGYYHCRDVILKINPDIITKKE